MTAADLVQLLAHHRLLGAAPLAQLEWVAAHGELVRFDTGDVLTPKGQPIGGLWIVLSGHLSLYVERGGGQHRALSWRGGEVSGQLPYSRLIAPPGDVRADEPTEMIIVPRAAIPDLIRDCHEVTAILVQAMIDRDRSFSSSALHEEKVASLGKLAAGLAHELNNPASAVARSAKSLAHALAELNRTARAVGALRLTADQETALEAARALCAAAGAAGRSALEQADREDAITDWLDGHSIKVGGAEALAQSAVTLDALDALARVLDGPALGTAVQWLSADAVSQQLASEIGAAATRIYDLVSAVKGFTYMDQAATHTPVDVGRGLSDTITVLSARARDKSVRVSLDVEADLPRVDGLGGELNQVWANLVDNALDAAVAQVAVTARREGTGVAVRVVDDGAGVPPAVANRIFDAFFTTKPVGQGTGLGLNIARRIVRRHLGEIEVDSHPGRTEFRVTLPASAAAAPHGTVVD